MTTKRTVIHEHFKSLEHLLIEMEERPLNAAFKDESYISSQEIREGGRWAGTRDYNEAMNVVKTGFKEPLEKMKKAVLRIGEMDSYTKPKLEAAAAGFIPHVPNAIMGLPLSMMKREPQPVQNKTIHLIYGFGASSTVKPEQLIEGGINFISLVNNLEKKGYSVKIDILFGSFENKTACIMTTNVKEYGQSLNLLKLTFPLVHPSMLRRVSFKWLETTPTLKDKGFTNGYGYPLPHMFKQDAEKEKEYLKEAGIIKTAHTYYCNAYQSMKSKTVEELAKIMGL